MMGGGERIEELMVDVGLVDGGRRRLVMAVEESVKLGAQILEGGGALGGGVLEEGLLGGQVFGGEGSLSIREERHRDQIIVEMCCNL